MIQCFMIGLVCYTYSFGGFMFLCQFMEWDVTFGIGTEAMAELLGESFPDVTLHSLMNTLSNMDWDVFWEETNTVSFILGIIGGLIIVGLVFLAYYIPYKALLSLVPQKIKQRSAKLSKLIALITSSLSHPIVWCACLYYGEELGAILAIIIGTVAVLFISYYVLLAVISLCLAPLAGAASVLASAGSGSSDKSSKEFSLSAMPSIIYDENNRMWRRRGIYGTQAEYFNSDGEEVSIYSAQVSEGSALTSAGTFHWY